MAGYFGNTKAEQQKKINEYIETLDEQIYNNDVNLQANKNYLLNGVLPQSTQMRDTRTTSEKLADFERLKQDIALELKDVYEPSVAYAIVQGLTESPLNYDNKLVVFLAQNIKDIARKLKDKYKYGVVGDKNDIETIVQLISKLYNESKQSLATVSDILKYQKNDISGTSEMERKLSNIDSKILTIERLSNNLNAPQINDIIVRVKRKNDEIIKHILSPNQFEELKDIIIHNVQGGEDYNMVRKVLFEYDEFLKSVLQMIDYVITLLDSSVRDINNNSLISAERKLLKVEQLYNEPSDLLIHFDNFRGLNELSRKFSIDKRRVQEQFLNRYNAMEDNQQQGQGIKGKGLITEQEPKRGRGRPRKTENTGKIKSEKIERYVGFGVNEINRHKLADKSIFVIRRKNKSNYPQLPSRLVDTSLKNVILDISGGKMPSYKDINEMSEDDKNYLHKILSISGLSDKFSIPTPALDKINKEIHEFEVMKGEILSGNDSKDLVKKFKLNVAKLSRIGVLPKREVNELLVLLADLNY